MGGEGGRVDGKRLGVTCDKCRFTSSDCEAHKPM